MPATIRDVAKAANVSASTVSRVYNNRGLVKEDTLRRIREAASALNYVPNATARSLSISRTQAIGCVVPEPSREYFSEILRGADEAAKSSKHHLLIACTHNDFDTTREVLAAMRGRVDGLLLLSPLFGAAQLQPYLPQGIPVVFLHSDADGTPYDGVTVDNEGGAHAATRYLIEQGHERIAVVAGREANRDVRERLAGFERALAEAGLVSNPAWRFEGDFSEESGLRAGRRLAEFVTMLPREESPTAVFAFNDYMAMGILNALHDADVSVPDDLAVVGFDDILSARYTRPALTTVRVPAALASQRAAECLLAHVTGDSAALHGPCNTVVPTELVVRATA